MLNLILRSLSAVILGILLIIYKDALAPFIVQLLGVSFILPGLIALGLQMFAYAESAVTFAFIRMFTSLGSIAFGAWLLLAPGFFVAMLMNLLGVILLLIGVYQILALLRAKRYGVSTSGSLYIMPLFIVLVGAFTLFNPLETASLPFIFIGVGAVIAGVSEFVSFMLLRKGRKNNSDAINIE